MEKVNVYERVYLPKLNLFHQFKRAFSLLNFIFDLFFNEDLRMKIS